MAWSWRRWARRMPANPLLPGRHLMPALVVLIGLMPVPAAAFLHASETDTDSGRALYVEHCAACHGGRNALGATADAGAWTTH